MSRCFLYPPPGYTQSEEKKGALIELIKLQKEKELRKQERVEKNKKREEKKKEREEKKQKREEKKRRREEKKQKREEKKKKREEKKQKREEMKESSKEKKDNVSQKVDKSDLVNCHERIDAETEQSQQSGLTEEHGQPDSVPVPSSSHDSTENSNKRKRQSSPVESSPGHDKANFIRQASKGQSVSRTLANGRQHNDCCYTSGRTSSGYEICSTSGKTGNRPSLNAVMHGVELQYKQLFESWSPPQLHDASLNPDDLDWLYPDRNNQDTQGAEKRQRSGGDRISCSRSSRVWHRAEYLPEIDVFALPYVVPY